MSDSRLIENGHEIPSEGYCDQPYVVKCADGAWCCLITTGRGQEGDRGQHIVSLRSLDQGRSWQDITDVEPADGPEASWAVPLVTPSGRIYAFYNYNGQNLRSVLADDPPYAGGSCARVDTLGDYAFRYSDDNGLTWSQQRFTIPVRAMAIDRANPYQGRVRFFWGVGKPLIHDGCVFIPFTKVGRFGESFHAEDECCFLRSDNLLSEPDPEALRWQTLPDGDHGLRAPAGPIAEEPTITALSDGSLFCTYRTTVGHPGHAYSRDGGHSWSEPAFMSRHPGGPLFCNPRAPNFVWRLDSGPHAGHFLYWFYNNDHPGYGPGTRSKAWLSMGCEQDGPDGRIIHWGEPELALYTTDFTTGPGYPDLIVEGERVFLTETQKTVARVHELSPSLLDSLRAHLPRCD